MRSGVWLALCVLGGWLSGCGSAVLDANVTCELALALTPTSGAPGDTVEVSGGPFTEARDTRVKVAGVDAVVVHVTRSGCDACDSCREDAGCGPCGRCLGEELSAGRRRACFGDPFEATTGSCGECAESLAFQVPALPPGPASVWVVNRDGTSEPVVFEVVAGVSATGDTGGAGG